MKKNNWSLFMVNGVIAILFGLLALLVPTETIVTLILYFGILILAGGLVMLLLSIRSIRNKKPYALILTESIIAIFIGLIIIFLPSQTLQIFLILIGIWASLVGLFQIIMAVRMKGVISNHTIFTINGVITLIFGLLLFFNPMGTAKFLMIVIGILALSAGVILVYLGFKVKNADSRV